MARWMCTLVNLLILTLLVNYATASISAYGAQFLIALHKIDDMHNEVVHFLLGTMASKIQVKITTNHFDGDQLEASVMLRRSLVTRYVLDKAYYPKSDQFMESFTYELNGQASFSLTVILYQADDTASSFLALPLNAWGRNYIAMSPGSNPTFHIVTLVTTELTISISGNYLNTMIFINVNNIQYGFGDTIKMFKLESRKSFMVSFCSITNGTTGFSRFAFNVKSSQPIGLIAGNCRSNIQERSCLSTYSTSEGGLEMAFPDALYGTEFIYFNDLHIKKDLIVHINDNISITVGGHVYAQTFYYEHYIQVEISRSGVLTAPKPVMAILKLAKRCYNPTDSELIGDLYHTLLVPNHLFYVFYLWRVAVVNLISQLNLVVETEFIQTTRLDDSTLNENVKWVVVNDQTTYSVAIFQVPPGSHTIRSNVNRKFGCYIFGVNKFIGHAHPAGFSNCVHEGNGTGQDVCTGGKDEESFAPGLRESDKHYPGLGTWNNWKGWTCTQKGVKVRTRSCESRKACRGMHDDISVERCKPSAAQKICDRGNVILMIIFIIVIMANY